MESPEDGLEVHEGLYGDEGADVAEGGRHRWAEAAVFQGEDLAHQEPGDRVQAQAERGHEEDHAEKGDPVEVGAGVDLVIGGTEKAWLMRTS